MVDDLKAQVAEKDGAVAELNTTIEQMKAEMEAAAAETETEAEAPAN